MNRAQNSRVYNGELEMSLRTCVVQEVVPQTIIASSGLEALGLVVLVSVRHQHFLPDRERAGVTHGQCVVNEDEVVVLAPTAGTANAIKGSGCGCPSTLKASGVCGLACRGPQ